MVDRSQMFQSAAYQALTPCARKVLTVILDKTERGGDMAAITLMDLAKLSGVSRGAGLTALKQVTLLGFVSIRQGPPPRLINTFAVLGDWQDHDAVEAVRLRKLSRLPKPGPKRVAKPRVVRHTPSLPTMPWQDDGR